MEKACRIIIDDILDGKITARKQLEVKKRQLCRDLKLSKFMSNADILEQNLKKRKSFLQSLKKSLPEQSQALRLLR